MATKGSIVVDPPSVFKAPVWKHFGFSGDKVDGVVKTDRSKVICKVCKSALKYSGNTTNLHTHLHRHHPELEDTKPQQGKAVEKPSTSKSAQQTLVDLTFERKFKIDSRRSAEITEAIAMFIAKDLRPYSIVENEGFVHMLKVLEPKYAIPSRQYFADRIIPKLYSDVKAEVIDVMSKSDYVSLTTDGWTSRSTDSFVTVTSHYINKDWELHSSVLQTRAMKESHTGENVAGLLVNACEEWGIKDKIVALVTDNASNMVVAAKTAEMSHVRCFAHTLNLASQKALKMVTRVTGCIRRIVSYFHRSTKATYIFKEKQALLNLPNHKLKNDVITRWNSSYDMVNRYLEQQPAVQATLLTKELRSGKDLPAALSDSELSEAEDIVQVMQPMKTATVVMCEDKQPTLSMVFPLYHTLLQKTGEANRDCDSRATREMRRAIHGDLVQRYKEDRSIMHKASALDPRFKGLPFLSDVDKMTLFSNLAIEAAELNPVTVKVEPVDNIHCLPPEPPLPDLPDVLEKDDNNNDPETKKIKLDSSDVADVDPSQKQGVKCALDDLFGDVFITQFDAGSKSKIDCATDEVEKYKKMQSIQLCSNPLDWWKEHEYTLPMLSVLARKYLCIPGTSVPSERVFSTAGDIVTSNRASLKAHHVDMLIFLKKNMKLK